MYLLVDNGILHLDNLSIYLHAGWAGGSPKHGGD